jgi:O-antigen ligase
LRGRITVTSRPARLWLAFLAVVVLAAAFGADGLYAWIGTPERHFGALAWLLCAVAFVAGHQVDRAAVQVAAAFAGAVAAVWAVVEMFGWEPVKLAGTDGHSVGPLGSSAYLGAALVLLGPIVVARWRIAAPVVLVALAASGARAAFVGAAVALVIAAALRRRAGRALVVVVPLLVVAAVATGLFTERNGGARGRIDEWRIAVRAIAARPLLGAGPEGYRIVFHEHVDDAYDRVHGRDPLPDRTHDAVLEVAATTGVAGAALYVALLVAVGALVVRALRQGSRSDVAIALGLLAYAVQSLFLFPLAELDPMAWLLAGVLARRMATDDELATVTVPAATPVMAGALATAALGVGALDVAADHDARTTLRALADERLPTGTAAARLRPDQVRYHLVAARAGAARQTPSGYRAALQALDDAAAISPADPVVERERARVLLDRANQFGDRPSVDAARRQLRRLLRDDPHNKELRAWLDAANQIANQAANQINGTA